MQEVIFHYRFLQMSRCNLCASFEDINVEQSCLEVSFRSSFLLYFPSFSLDKICFALFCI